MKILTIISIMMLCFTMGLSAGNKYNVTDFKTEIETPIEGGVEEVPLTIYPVDADEYGIFYLGSVVPGERKYHPYNDDNNPEFFPGLKGWLSFNVQGAKGYNVRINASFEKEIDKLRIEPIWKVGPTAAWDHSLNVGIPNSGESPWTFDKIITSSNGFYILGDIEYMEALPGAPAGLRTFVFTMNCEYFEI
jgi:hypothetical protein